MISLFWSKNSIEQKFHRLLAEINNSFHDPSSLATLKQFEKMDIKSEEMYNFLENVALLHKNDKIRYIATKLLHKNYPEKANKLIRRLLSQDSNYKIRVVKLTDSKRHNINDVLDLNIKRIRNKEKMVNDIFTYNFTEFVLSWKDYIDLFQVFYNTELNCFILSFKNSQEFAYLCNKSSDPFYALRVDSILSTNEMRNIVRNSSKIRIIMEFFRKLLLVKDGDIKALFLRPEQETTLPNYRIFCDSGEFLIYLHL